MSHTVRDMARSLDEAALEALASKGLARRAAADLAAGKATVLAEDAEGARVLADGETVQVLAGGPRLGGCTCPAPGVCRHRLTALLLLREGEASTAPAAPTPDPAADRAPSPGVAPAPASPTAAEPQPHARSSQTDWAAVMGALDARALARFAGPATWRDALDAAAPPATAELTAQDGSLQVRLAGEAPVVFLREGGLEGALTKAPERRRKGVVVLAAVLARRALGLPELGAEPSAATASPTAEAAADAGSLVAAQSALKRCLAAGLTFVPPAVEAELLRVAVAGRVEAIPRLAGLLRRLSAALAALRLRGVEADPDAVLTLMAETFALTVALQAVEDAERRAALTGQLRQDYAPAGNVELFGLGARVWSSPAGAHGVTGYFHAPQTGRSYTLGHARPNRADVSFDPRTAFHQTPLWGEPLARLCAGRLVVDDALASPTGRLSTAQPSRGRLTDWTPSSEATRDWANVFDDWRALEADLQGRFGGGFSGAPVNEVPVVLRFGRFAALRFDELDQTLVWPLADGAGRWLGLTLPYEADDRARIEALEALVSRERPWAVLAIAQAEAERLVLRPYGLWAKGQHLLDTAFPRSSRTGILGPGLIERLRAASLGSGPRGFSLSATASDRLLGDGWALLLRKAEMGRGLADAAFAEGCAEIAGRLSLAGLEPLAGTFRPLATTPDRSDLCLRAAWALVSARRARRRLDWMR